MSVYQKGDWVSHKRMKIVGKILSVDTENRECEVMVADALPTQNWASRRLSLPGRGKGQNMKTTYKRIQKAFDLFGDDFLDLSITEMDRSKFEMLFKYLTDSKFEIKYFLSKPQEEDIEVQPEVIFPLGPDDLIWNFASIKGNGLSFGLVFYGVYDYVFLTFEGASISNVKKAANLVKVIKELAHLLTKYVEIVSDKSQIRVMSVEPMDI